MHLVVSRRLLWIAAALALLLVAFLVWHLDADRQLDRRWRGLVEAVEARHAGRIHRFLAPDYTDRWGYSRETITADARLALHHFEQLELRPASVSVQRTGDRATITATIRVNARGSDLAERARLRVNSIYTPYMFEWRRTGGTLFGEWELVRFDQPELDLRGFRRGAF